MALARKLAPMFLVSLLCACGSESTGPAPGEPASVVVTPATATVVELDSFAISAQVLDSAGNVLEGVPLQWNVANQGGAEPDISSGRVRARQAGTYTVYAFVNTAVFGTSVVTVTEAKVGSVEVTPSVDTIVVGGRATFTARIRDDKGRDLPWREPRWTVADPSIATAAIEAGNAPVFAGAGVGTTRVTATASGVSDGASLTVLVLQYTSLAVGHDHACGRTTGSRWFCWGRGEGLYAGGKGPAGLQTALAFDTLIASVGGAGSLSEPGSVCALSAEAAYCWGRDDSGAVGDGPGGQASCYYPGLDPIGIPGVHLPCAGQPQPVSGGLSFRTLANGGGHTTCGITTGNAAYCWGANQYGQLGNGGSDEACALLVSAESAITRTIPCSTMPAPVAGAHSFTQIATGLSSTCALTLAGGAYCWGDNSLGQLGTGTTISSALPLLVSGGLTFRRIAVSATGACGITAADQAYCWGSDRLGLVGDGPDADQCLVEEHQYPCRTAPTLVSGNLRFSSISIAESHACGVTIGGVGYCWGDRNGIGAPIGTACEPASSGSSTCAAPVAVAGGLSLLSIQVGNNHSCGITTARVVYCWGVNWDEQLGVPRGALDASAEPLKLVGQP
jgi:hypothetical protein